MRELPAALVAVGRASGLAGAAAALAGIAAVVAVATSWYEVSAELAMLGAAQDRVVTSLPGWSTPAGAVAAVAGAVAATLGALLAFDRHPGWTRPVLVAAGLTSLACGAIASVRRPSLDGFPDDAGALDQLRGVVDQLPRGVELSLSVRSGVGATAALVAGVVVLGAVAAARDLDRR